MALSDLMRVAVFESTPTIADASVLYISMAFLVVHNSFYAKQRVSLQLWDWTSANTDGPFPY